MQKIQTQEEEITDVFICIKKFFSEYDIESKNIKVEKEDEILYKIPYRVFKNLNNIRNLYTTNNYLKEKNILDLEIVFDLINDNPKHEVDNQKYHDVEKIIIAKIKTDKNLKVEEIIQILNNNNPIKEAETNKFNSEKRKEFVFSGVEIRINKDLWVLDQDALYYRENDQAEFSENLKIKFINSEYKIIEFLYNSRNSSDKHTAKELSERLGLAKSTTSNAISIINKKIQEKINILNFILNNKTANNKDGDGYYLNPEYL